MDTRRTLLSSLFLATLAAPAAEEVLGRAEPYSTMSIRMFGIPESELAKTLREIQDAGGNVLKTSLDDTKERQLRDALAKASTEQAAAQPNAT